jgi:hypothetical protein
VHANFFTRSKAGNPVRRGACGLGDAVCGYRQRGGSSEKDGQPAPARHDVFPPVSELMIADFDRL